MTRLTANQIIAKFRNHSSVRVVRVCGIYEIWRCEDGAFSERMASYDLAELKVWATRF